MNFRFDAVDYDGMSFVPCRKLSLICVRNRANREIFTMSTVQHVFSDIDGSFESEQIVSMIEK